MLGSPRAPFLTRGRIPFVLSVCLLVSCQEPAEPSPGPATLSGSEPGISGRIERRVASAVAIDGDTIELPGGERVRYLGIDTPERGAAFHAQAARRNAELIAAGNLLLVREHSETDRYGRLLRHVWVEREGGEQVLVGETLVREGLAKATPYPPDIALATRLRRSEIEARTARRGLWAVLEIETYYLGSSDKFHRPECASARKLSHAERFETRDEATASGLRPARCCNP